MSFWAPSRCPTGFPYVLKDDEIGAFSVDPDFGPSWLVPKVRDRLVDPAVVDGRPVTFTVSRANVDAFAAFEPGKRGFPEYVHARTRVTNGAFENLNDQRDVIAAMKKPKSYQALHYVDYTGEGWVTADLGSTGMTLRIVPAYVLVSAPDFFP